MVKNKNKWLSSAIFCLFLFILIPQATFAQTFSKVRRTPETYEPSTEQQLSDKALKSAFFLMKIRDGLGFAKDDYKALDQAISQTKTALEKTKTQVTTLKDQIGRIDGLIDQSNKKIYNVMTQALQLEQDILRLSQDLETKSLALQYEQDLLRDYVTFLYVKEQELGTVSADESGLSTLKLLLADATVNESLKELKYLEIMDRTGRGIIKRAEQSLAMLTREKDELDDRRAALEALKISLEHEKEYLEDQKKAKAELLRATKGQEKVYQELLAQSLKQQQEVLQDIQILRQNLRLVEGRIFEMGEDFNVDNLKGFIDRKITAIYELQKQEGNDDWIWPASVSRGISTFFRDQAYQKTFGIVHNAIDIRVPEKTPIRAPLDGIVYRVKDNDNSNYSYLILAHKDNILTVYGHINQSLVKEGDVVRAGDVIALSGGVPGTKGAGYLTTGAHLHFEILKNGQYADPLEYLPLEYVSIDTLPEKYLRRLDKNKWERVQKLQEAGEEPFDADEIESVIERSGEGAGESFK